MYDVQLHNKIWSRQYKFHTSLNTTALLLVKLIDSNKLEWSNCHARHKTSLGSIFKSKVVYAASHRYLADKRV